MHALAAPSKPGAAAMPGSELNKKFKVVRFLGKGSFGSVWEVKRMSDGQSYALKEMDVKGMGQAERQDAANEVRLLASVAHPNVIRYNEAFLDGQKLCIVMEYAPDGDLNKIIKKYQTARTPMPEDLIWKLFIQAVSGIAALHQLQVIHRDIKPGNIMVTSQEVVKIGDLGIAKILKGQLATTAIGTPHYMPPEVWRSKPYSYTSDSWALGCLLYEMAALKVPFEARSMNELKMKVQKGVYPPLPSMYSPDLTSVVRILMDLNADKRPTAGQLLAHPALVARMRLLPAQVTGAPPGTAQSALLDTIKVGPNLQNLKAKLPPAQYGADFLSLSEEPSSASSFAAALPPSALVQPQARPAQPQQAPGRIASIQQRLAAVPAPPMAAARAPAAVPAVPMAGVRAPSPIGGMPGKSPREAAAVAAAVPAAAAKRASAPHQPPAGPIAKPARASEAQSNYGNFYNSPAAAVAGKVAAAGRPSAVAAGGRPVSGNAGGRIVPGPAGMAGIPDKVPLYKAAAPSAAAAYRSPMLAAGVQPKAVAAAGKGGLSREPSQAAVGRGGLGREPSQVAAGRAGSREPSQAAFGKPAAGRPSSAVPHVPHGKQVAVAGAKAAAGRVPSAHEHRRYY